MVEPMDWGTMAVILALMMNLCGLVWTAARFATVVQRLDKWAEGVTELIQQHDKDIAVLKDRGRRRTDATLGT